MAAESEKQKYIVYVEDDARTVDLVKIVLRREGYVVTGAPNGREGLKLIAEVKPDLVLLDLMMPVLTGKEMLRQMRADPNFADIPVVIMTALPGAVPADELPGHQAVLQKPFTPERLFEVVRASLRTGVEAQRPTPGD